MPEKEPISTKDWIELAKLAKSSTLNRRAMEWKLAFGLWTGVGLFTACFFTGPQITPPWWLFYALGGAYILIMAVVIWGWQWPMQGAYAGDHAWFVYYTKMAIGTPATLPADARLGSVPTSNGASANASSLRYCWHYLG